ncbi:hypothetical protein M2171_003686 [Bradyrhizobium japonicum USDA 38]|uniref:hypothetical protein n=1 Tax=Bradyrhizobium japonicum TaxID=375 RepID=UPI0003F70390|nr:hypothetical protein [Bradyrhizobium japonicum]MCS3894553.1 hypothetical protein [Bradyrhizobium japonicum USDA 38]MCS3947067.1 hypothetical protein [Bradyrhizobium japonicum]MCW2220102.1 hypothetical protein [Bradyrhizobium japonicum]MCW2344716.1 hypothetical protein [Bradyrhizobium japonicum]
MTALSGIISNLRARLDTRAALATLVLLHSAVTCLSLIRVATFQSYIHFSGDRVWIAVAIASVFSIVSLLFAAARFSFGYFVGFYFYTMILGFLWIDVFSGYEYPHLNAGISAALSIILFLVPALFITAPIRQVITLSEANFARLLNLVLALSVVTVAIAATYNFRLVSISQIYDFRSELQFPTPLRYLIGWTSGALLPFAAACFWTRGSHGRAICTLLLLLLFYPVTLTKTAFFAPAWFAVMVLLSRYLETRASAILSLFLPMLAGVILISISISSLIGTHIYEIFDVARIRVFNLINIRMIATPSSALDIYNDYFAHHPLTYFCQISLLKPLMHCPYQDQLSVLMQDTYGFGMINASLFATEGIASVGPYFAPLTALASGFALALGNRAAAGLPQRFVLISCSTLPHVLLNTPLTVAMLTHGTALLFLLWYVMPRSIFAQPAATG